MAKTLEYARLMTRGGLIGTAILLVGFASGGGEAAWGQTPVQPRATEQQPPTVVFKAGVDLVRIAAIVRDKKGRFVQDLSARDFEVLDNGLTRTIADFRSDVTGVSIALLFDVSGSMEGQ